MIIDSLKNHEQYCSLHPRFKEAFQFILDKGNTAQAGRYEIDGTNLYVMIVDADLKKPEDAKLEIHHQYIDIQVVLSDAESYGWKAASDCKSPIGQYDNQKDILFFEDTHSAIIKANSGEFLIFFPADAHAPTIGQGSVRKAIIKIKI